MASLKDLLPGFNANAVPMDDTPRGSLLPTNIVYGAEITSAELKKTNNGGDMLEVEYSIFDPEQYNRRKVWQRINVTNASPEAQRIGQEELARLALAVGLPELDDTDKLLGQNVRMRVGVEKGKGGYADKNKVVGYEKAKGIDRVATPAVAKPKGASTAPWNK